MDAWKRIITQAITIILVIIISMEITTMPITNDNDGKKKAPRPPRRPLGQAALPLQPPRMFAGVDDNTARTTRELPERPPAFTQPARPAQPPSWLSRIKNAMDITTSGVNMPGGLSPEQLPDSGMGGNYGPDGQPIISGDLQFGPDGRPFTIGQDSITQNPNSPYHSYGGYRIPHKLVQRLVLPGQGERGSAHPPPSPFNSPSNGFGTNYGGGYGGGGGGGGGYSYNDRPAWYNEMMRLFSWNIK